MYRLNKTESGISFILLVLSISEGFVFPDYLEVALAVVVSKWLVKHFPVHRYSVDIFSCYGSAGMLGSDRKQNTA